MHVVCGLPNASNRIDGKLFVPVKVKDRVHHVSEALTEAEAERLLKIPGFQLFRADPKEVETAVAAFKADNLNAVVSGDGDKDRTIAELQRTLSINSEQLGKANMLILELREENSKLKQQIGEPSLTWSRKSLADYAENLGLIVNQGTSKEEILEMIEASIAQRG